MPHLVGQSKHHLGEQLREIIEDILALRGLGGRFGKERRHVGERVGVAGLQEDRANQGTWELTIAC